MKDSFVFLVLSALASSAAIANPAVDPPVTPAPTTGKAVDNTATNQRDKSGETTTPMDQSNKRADLLVEANVRKAVVDDKSLSTLAHNVKIVTNGGVVTLRGPVKTAAEKARVEEIVTHVPGVTSVTNALDVK